MSFKFKIKSCRNVSNTFLLPIPVLYSGPLSEAKVIFPVGEFKLYAEIHEEAGAYATYVINPKFSTVLPDEDDYNNANIEELLKQYRHNFLRKYFF